MTVGKLQQSPSGCMATRTVHSDSKFVDIEYTTIVAPHIMDEPPQKRFKVSVSTTNILRVHRLILPSISRIMNGLTTSRLTSAKARVGPWTRTWKTRRIRL